MAVVNWARLGRAIDHWVHLGFTYVDSPWRVNPAFIYATMDENDPDMMNRDTYQGGRDYRCPVGSGEQSMLSMRFSSRLADGKFVTCTPCFRDDAVDILHQKEFMKVELMDNTDVSHRALTEMIVRAREFFVSEIGEEHESAIRVTGGSTSDGSYAYDIELNGIEIGSYGSREWMGCRWIYGTGLAEPRFSTVSAAMSLASGD